MSCCIEKYRFIVATDEGRYVIAWHEDCGQPSYARLTDRGPVNLTSEERARLEPIAKVFGDAVSTVRIS